MIRNNWTRKEVEEISLAMEYLLAREKGELKVVVDSLENAHNSNTISKEQQSSKI